MLLPLAVLTVIVVGALFEAAAAVGWRSVGSLPGEGPAGEGIVLGVSLFAMFVGGVLLSVFSGTRETAPLAWLLPLAGAAFLVARFYSFDPYYAPARRRMSDGGILSPTWVYALVALAVVAALLARARPRAGFAMAAPVMILSALTAFVASGGH